ncbi:hypothetical protein GLAREA_00311 [Glarea lozoyensis ATCC 20868]|uniref:Uncharacterized protein n=1 Tax=Glarea lozoyensis (strain ATCC 20868 / MF5171) TaxID=1116229 RepID=S3DAZ5_GLAL2|nr:uncharacterized protein GLAREA_00311 [Glarea lozoyensis ATCC 20868]EPE29151.1 hypothetical protein GLAREA_00311 [Glarea lozoyensis ATCC 20868]
MTYAELPTTSLELERQVSLTDNLPSCATSPDLEFQHSSTQELPPYPTSTTSPGLN